MRVCLLSISSALFIPSSISWITIPFSSGCTTRNIMFITAKTRHAYPNIKYVISHLSPTVDVRKLVISAPATFPKLPQDYQKPIIVPRPFLPNQLANIRLQAGHPTDWQIPFTAKRKEKKKGFIQLAFPQIAIVVVIPVTKMNDITSSILGFKWSLTEPLINNPIE